MVQKKRIAISCFTRVPYSNAFARALLVVGALAVPSRLLANAATLQAGNTSAQEYGDAVYRDLGLPGIEHLGHAALFYGVNSAHDGLVVEMHASAWSIFGDIRVISLQSMIGGYGYWGAYSSTNSSSRPDTFAERATIISYADELDTQDPGYPFLGSACIDPQWGWGSVLQPSEVDDIRCDGVVEYCFEYGTDFPVWGKNNAHHDISLYPQEHNNLYTGSGSDPNTELAPIVQCGRAGGYSTYLTSPAATDFPSMTVALTYYSDRTVATMRASDQSGIHRIRYKWGPNGAEHDFVYGLHPTQDYEEEVATTYATNHLYFKAQDGAGNEDGLWHLYLVTVNQAPNAPSGEDPSDGASGISVTANLDWDCSDPDGDTVYYTVWLSKGNDVFSSGEIIKDDAPGSYAYPGTMEFSSHYYWKVRADDHSGGTATVDDWDFYTEPGPPTPPTGVTVDHAQFCEGAHSTIMLTASGGSGEALKWYSGACGGAYVATGNPSVVISAPSQTTTYYARWETTGYPGSACGSVTVQVDDVPTPPTQVTSDTSFYCTEQDTQITLTAIGGSGDSIEWYLEPGPGGGWIGSGEQIVIPAPGYSPGGYWEFKARWESAACGVSEFKSVFVTVGQTPPSSPVNSGPVCEGEALWLTGLPSQFDSYEWTGPNGFHEFGDSIVLWPADPGMTGTYYLTTTLDGCVSEPGATYVEVNPVPGGAPGYLVPENGSECILARADLEWLPIIGATSYDVYWGVSDPPAFWDTVVTTSASPPGEEGRDYSWFVVARNDSCEGPEGPIWTYATEALPDIHDSSVLNGTSTGDQFGVDVALVGDLNEDGYSEYIIGSSHEVNGGLVVGGAQVRSGIDGSLVHHVEGDQEDSQFGAHVAGLSDITGDGEPDFIVGAPKFTTAAGARAGRAVVYSGETGLVRHTFDGPVQGAWFGSGVAAAGDLNSDGVGDILVASERDDSLFPGGGKVEVFSGADWSVLYTWPGSHASQYFGSSVAGGVDIDRDGVADILIGSEGDDTNGEDAGSVTVISGASGLPFSWSPLLGDMAGDAFGTSVAFPGNVDGDEFEDILVGIRYGDFNGVDRGGLRLYSGASGVELLTVRGAEDGDQLGHAVSGVGDVDGDGYPDIAGGGAGSDTGGDNAGRVALFSSADGSLLKEYFGDAAGDNMFAVARVGDNNFDGDVDLLIGAYQAGNGGRGYARLVSTACASPNESGMPICFGDGSGASCPCGDGGVGGGCANSGSLSGAKLEAQGTPAISNDTFRLYVSQAAPNKPGLVLSGTADLSPGVNTVADSAGLLCVGGTTQRGDVIFTDGSGIVGLPNFQGAPYGMASNVMVGSASYYQFWFRDPNTACAPNDTGAGDFNFSNSWMVVWQS